jgi:hypothetical protein
MQSNKLSLPLSRMPLKRQLELLRPKPQLRKRRLLKKHYKQKN